MKGRSRERRSTRSGSYRSSAHVRAFYPAALPPTPPLTIDPELALLLSDADRAIGRLDAATELLPSPDLFVRMYVRKEAVFSSQIEGTQASLTDLLEFEAEVPAKVPADVAEVANYVKALNLGLQRLQTLPLSLRLLREIHKVLMAGVRGGNQEPGEFRRTQNWIGPKGSTPNDAIFIPPPPQEVTPSMGALERFLHDESMLPPLIKCGLAHAQFETIHPFLDGNGRLGRLLITFWLCWRGVLKRPLLYLSLYFKHNQQEYYDRLQRVRDHGEWEEWLKFFLRGVSETATGASDTAREILHLREKHRTVVAAKTGTSAAQLLVDRLFETPVVTAKMVAEMIGRTYPVANDLLALFTKLGLLTQILGGARNRVYSYAPYLDLLESVDVRSRPGHRTRSRKTPRTRSDPEEPVHG